MSAINSPTVPVQPALPEVSEVPRRPADTEGLMSLFDSAESKLDKVLGKTTTQRMQRVGVLAAFFAVAGAVMAYRRMKK